MLKYWINIKFNFISKEDDMKSKDRYVVLIPARGGSKSIPLKNIKEIAGQPLIYYSLDAAVNSEYVDKVYVSTESDIIKKVVKKYDKPNNQKIHIVNRSMETASDSATTEDVMLEFASNYEFENIILIQCTNPLITTYDINESIKKHSKYDSILSTVVQKRFYWKLEKDGTVTEIGHDIKKRPRRQDWDGVLAENGSIYIISKENLIKGRCRLYGRIGTHIMPAETYFEIDEPSDWEIVEKILLSKQKD